MSRRSARASAGKRIRYDPDAGYGAADDEPFSEQQQQNYEAYNQQQQQQSSGGAEAASSGDKDDDAPFDVMAYYQEQRKQMLEQSSQHYQSSQMEIQEAQEEAARRDAAKEQQGSATGEGDGRRRSRTAATAAKAALSMMSEDLRETDRHVFEAPAAPGGHAASGQRGRGRPRGSGLGSRGAAAAARAAAASHRAKMEGRPYGTTARAMAERRSARGGDQTDTSPEERIRRKPGRKTITEIQAEDETSLYYIIRNGKASLQQVVDDWIDTYKSDRDGALLALMQFFISASGCKGKITPDMQSSMEHDKIIRIMTEEFDEETGEYPLVTAGMFWKKFRGNFCDFIQLLVKQCQYSIIYDQHLMDNVISLLTQLSDSQVRAFRHTATLASMKLMTALVDVALTVSINLENTQRQYDAEQQKSRDKRAPERLEGLMTRRQELEENTDEIKNMLTYMFKSVFVHRYRDTLPEIRSICMYEIGQWMVKYHTNFLDDTYLKYIGWTIHDKVGDVRLKCLQALQPLYGNPELKGKLELFTSKFKDRIVSMTLDKEFDVAVEGVKLVISILRHHRDMLTDKDCENIYELVFCSHRAVAQAAGEFLNERLFLPDGEVDAHDVRTKRGKKRLPNTNLIRDLVQFFIESELHEHGAYLVDSLIESNPMMKDWECMTDLLLEEPGAREEPLEDKQEASLIEIMVCCVRQAATGEPPVGRGPTRKVLSAKELKQVNDDKQSLTAHFIQTLPPLLKKYLPDQEKIQNLMLIPQFFDLEIYTTSRQEKNLDALVNLMQEIVNKHSSKDVLETCAKTLEKLCDDHFAIFSRCDTARSRLLDMVVNGYKEASDEFLSLLDGGEEPNDDDRFGIVSSLKKVEAFYDCHNASQWNIWETMFETLVRYKDAMVKGQGNDLKIPEEAVKATLCSCYFGLIWDQNYLENTTERDSTASDVQTLKQRVERYMDAMKEVLVLGTSVLLKEEAFASMADLLIFFCPKSETSRNNVLAPLYYKADKSVQQMLNDFIQNNVFIEDDDSGQDDHTKIEELHKRRNFLAGFCKLIVYNVLPTKTAAEIIKHYVTYYNDYGDIIKTTLGKARENNKVNCAKTMVQAMILKFNDIQHAQSRKDVDRNTVEFHTLKELAKRFALSFGLDALKNREAVAQLHREGILLACTPMENPDDPTGPPPNLAFLDVLTEFTNKLLKQDKRVVLAYLDKRMADGMPSSSGEDWQPLHIYRNSLVHGEGDLPTLTSKRPYTRKRRIGEDEDDDADDDADEEEA